MPIIIYQFTVDMFALHVSVSCFPIFPYSSTVQGALIYGYCKHLTGDVGYGQFILHEYKQWQTAHMKAPWTYRRDVTPKRQGLYYRVCIASMAWCQVGATLLLTQWDCISFALRHRYPYQQIHQAISNKSIYLMYAAHRYHSSHIPRHVTASIPHGK